jgi:hypothetical protein
VPGDLFAFGFGGGMEKSVMPSARAAARGRAVAIVWRRGRSTFHMIEPQSGVM